MTDVTSPQPPSPPPTDTAAPLRPRRGILPDEKRKKHPERKPNKPAKATTAAKPKAPTKAKAKPKPKPPRVPELIEVAPMAAPARLRSRHFAIALSLVFHVCLPLLIAAWYLWDRTEDRYASQVGFTIQQDQNPILAGPLTSAFSALGGGGGTSDGDILYEYLHSQHLVAAIDAMFDLRGHYAQFHDTDPILSLNPDATLEDLVAYWERVLKVSYDDSSGLIEFQLLAYDPDTAQAIARAVLANAQTLINDLNTQARQDKIRYAEADLAQAQTNLGQARADLVAFRTRTQIVDPATDLAGRLGIVNTLQQQLAEALVDFDMLSQSTGGSDPRVLQAQTRIDVIRARLSEERANVARGQENDTGEDYPTLLAQYEGLSVAGEIADQSFRIALGALEAARAEAARQSRYLAAYIPPTLPQTPISPDRWLILALLTLFALLSWAICVLIYYSLRDSR